MRILGIETSCDETGVAIIEARPGDKKVKLLSNIVASSLIFHSKTGGIIPEKAAREQVKYIIPVIKKALHPHLTPLPKGEGRVRVPGIDAIAVTVGPGLNGSLLVGVETAKTLAYVWNKPIIPVNHLIGHIYANFIQETDDRRQKTDARKTENTEGLSSVLSAIRPESIFSPPILPAIALIVSGGHTDLVLMKKHGSIKWLGGTRDDAAGEAFDKIGRLLELPYPGGPSIEKASERGDPSRFNFPRPMIDSIDFDFSFSGLKTAVLRKIQTMKQFNNVTIADLSASVQQAIIDVLVTKTLKAAQKYRVKSILLGGGVSANQKLRDQFALEIRNIKLEIPLSVPPKHLCTDNGAMIATAAFFNYKEVPWRKLTADPELYFD